MTGTSASGSVVRDNDGNEIRSARSMSELQADVFAGKVNPGNIVAVREIVTSATPDTDTAVFSGASGLFQITQDGDAVIVSGPTARHLRERQARQFTDTTIDLRSTSPAALRLSVVAGDAQATVAFTAPRDRGRAADHRLHRRADRRRDHRADRAAGHRPGVRRDRSDQRHVVQVPGTGHQPAGTGEFSPESSPVVPVARTGGNGTDDGTGTGAGDDTGTEGENEVTPAPTTSVDPAPTTTVDPAPTTTVDPTPTPTVTTPAVVKTPGAPAGVTATEGDGSSVVRWTAPPVTAVRRSPGTRCRCST